MFFKILDSIGSKITPNQLPIRQFIYSFGFDEEEKDDIVYTTWLSLSLRALTSIFNYSPTSKKWTQAHR